MLRTFDVMTIGSATQDVFVRSKALEEHADDDSPDGIAACFLMGSKMPIDELTFSTGGGATNAAVTFARHGMRVTCLSRVGSDVIADEILDDLKREKIDTRFMQRDAKRKSAYSIILLSGTGHRAIFTHRGASQALDRRAFPWHHWAKKMTRTRIAKWIYLTSLGGDMAALKDVFAHAERTNARIAWNPGNKELERGRKTLRPYMEQADIVSLNREEAAMLSGVDAKDTKAILRASGELPAVAFLLTDGQRGAYVRSEGKTLFAPAIKGKRVNTTGAGDAFGSGFVASWMKREDVRTALADAMLNAHGVVTHMGAKAGILKGWPTAKDGRKARIR
ncbi:MAG: carbohydrate kinase family protein [Candidatus Uhrbacteria bacterium]|nr:carbohydrate kinase family protein [Candidatus Uhrbacteria bacterium]